MFHSAALKLTGWYLAIIMTLSLGCSFALYHVSSNDLQRNAQRQIGFIDNSLRPRDLRDYIKLWQKQLSDNRNHLKANLVLFNTAVLVGGGAISYLLARRTLEPIEEALDAQKRFTADASHELRTPLTAMQAEIEVALRNPKLTKQEAVELVKSNLEEVAKLKGLSEGLLRLAQGQTKVTDDSIASLSDIVKDTIKRLEKTAHNKKIKLVNETSDIPLKGDQSTLTELLVILVDNSIKYSPEGSSVNISSAKQGKTARIQVKDRGVGIKASDMPHIFERFYRADGSRSKGQTEGYGLGLALAKKITDAHGGFIEVKSAPSKGSTFTIALPSA